MVLTLAAGCGSATTGAPAEASTAQTATAATTNVAQPTSTAQNTSTQTTVQRHRAVPDVVGLALSSAVQQLIADQYCIQLRIGNRVAPTDFSYPVEHQAPDPGSEPRSWSIVILTVGVPVPPGTPVNAHVDFGVDSWGTGKVPCPAIKTSGS